MTGLVFVIDSGRQSALNQEDASILNIAATEQNNVQTPWWIKKVSTPHLLLPHHVIQVPHPPDNDFSNKKGAANEIAVHT